MCRDQDQSSLFPISEGKFNGFKSTLVIYFETRVIGKCEIHPNLQPRNKSTLRRFSLEKTCHFYPARVVKILSNDSDVNFTQRGMKITSQKLFLSESLQPKSRQGWRMHSNKVTFHITLTPIPHIHTHSLNTRHSYLCSLYNKRFTLDLMNCFMH